MRTRSILPSLLLCCGCATAVRGSGTGLVVESVPAGAAAVSDVAWGGETPDGAPDARYRSCAPTPCRIPMSRKASPRVTVAMDGYQPITFQVVSSRMTPNEAVPEGAIIAGLPPGSVAVAGEARALSTVPTGAMSLYGGGLFTLGAGPVVDQISGANRSLSPNPVSVRLAPFTAGDRDEAGEGGEGGTR